MTRWSGWDYARKHRIAIAIECEANHLLHVAAGRALSPQAAGSGAVVHLAGLDRALERFIVGVRHHQHFARGRVLRHDDDSPLFLVEIHGGEIQGRAHDAAPAAATAPAGPRISRTIPARFAFVAIASPPKAVALP